MFLSWHGIYKIYISGFYDIVKKYDLILLIIALDIAELQDIVLAFLTVSESSFS